MNRALIAVASAAMLCGCAASRAMVRADSSSLNQRLHAARPGDTISLEPGTYAGGWWIDVSGAPGRPIVITAANGPGTVVVRGGDEGINIAEGAHDIVIQNLEVRDANDNLIHIQGGAHDIVLRDLHVHHAGENGDGIKANQVHDLRIERIDCHDPGPRPDRPDGNPSQECIDLVDVERVVVRDVYLHDGGNQLLFVKGGSRDVVIERSLFTRQGADAIDPCVGLGGATDEELLRGSQYEAHDVVFRNNVVAGCRAGAIGVYDAERVWIVNNTIVDTADIAIQFRAGNGPAAESRDVHIVNDWFVQPAGTRLQAWAVRSHGLRDLDIHQVLFSLAPEVALDSVLITVPNDNAHVAQRVVTLSTPVEWNRESLRAWASHLDHDDVGAGAMLRGAGRVTDDVRGALRSADHASIGAVAPGGAVETPVEELPIQWPSRAPSVDATTVTPAPRATGGGPSATRGCVRGCGGGHRAQYSASFTALAIAAGAAKRTRR